MYLLSRGQVETGRRGEDTLVSLVSDIVYRLQHGDMFKYDCEKERKYSQLQYGDMSETETVGEKVLCSL